MSTREGIIIALAFAVRGSPEAPFPILPFAERVTAMVLGDSSSTSGRLVLTFGSSSRKGRGIAVLRTDDESLRLAKSGRPPTFHPSAQKDFHTAGAILLDGVGTSSSTAEGRRMIMTYSNDSLEFHCFDYDALLRSSRLKEQQHLIRRRDVMEEEEDDNNDDNDDEDTSDSLAQISKDLVGVSGKLSTGVGARLFHASTVVPVAPTLKPGSFLLLDCSYSRIILAGYLPKMGADDEIEAITFNKASIPWAGATSSVQCICSIGDHRVATSDPAKRVVYQDFILGMKNGEVARLRLFIPASASWSRDLTSSPMMRPGSQKRPIVQPSSVFAVCTDPKGKFAFFFTKVGIEVVRLTEPPKWYDDCDDDGVFHLCVPYPPPYEKSFQHPDSTPRRSCSTAAFLEESGRVVVIDPELLGVLVLEGFLNYKECLEDDDMTPMDFSSNLVNRIGPGTVTGLAYIPPEQ